jgi:hypothetical protein
MRKLLGLGVGAALGLLGLVAIGPEPAAALCSLGYDEICLFEGGTPCTIQEGEITVYYGNCEICLDCRIPES